MPALPPVRGAREVRAPSRRRPPARRRTKPEPAPEPCPRPLAAATSPARAAPSPPAPCPSATPRSYLMTIAPPRGGRSSPPRREVSPRPVAGFLRGVPTASPQAFNSGRAGAGRFGAPVPSSPPPGSSGTLTMFFLACNTVRCGPTLGTWLCYRRKKQNTSHVPASWQVCALDPVFSPLSASPPANSSIFGLDLSVHDLCLLFIVHLCTFVLDFGTVSRASL